MSTAMVTDVFEAMRRRRMHRYFAPTPFDDETPRAFALGGDACPGRRQRALADSCSSSRIRGL
jgi:hypothetical protein